jgi:hypothetical protein
MATALKAAEEIVENIPNPIFLSILNRMCHFNDLQQQISQLSIHATTSLSEIE